MEYCSGLLFEGELALHNTPLSLFLNFHNSINDVVVELCKD